MSVYEELNGTVSIDKVEAKDIAVELLLRFHGIASAQPGAVCATDDHEVYVRVSETRGEVRVCVEENNHAVSDAEENSKLFKWILKKLKQSPSAKGTLYRKSEMCYDAEDWAVYGRRR